MIQRKVQYLCRYWLILIALLILVIGSVQLPLYGAPATPTAPATLEIGTVPDLLLVETPTNTPVPIVTVSAPSSNAAVSDQARDGVTPVGPGNNPPPTALASGSESSTSGSEPAAQSDNQPTLVAPLPLRLDLQPNPVWVWQGQQLFLHFIVTNSGPQWLTSVQLRDDLPAELHFTTAAIGGNGRLRPPGTPAQSRVVQIDWPQLAPGSQVTATVTVQVAPSTPPGMFIDNLALVQSAEGSSAVAGLTLVMPPAGLPRFR